VRDLHSIALTEACIGNHLPIAKSLLDRGTNVGHIAPGYSQSLTYAVKTGSAELVKLLLDRGAIPDPIS
jgi:ankyrin repeat protein